MASVVGIGADIAPISQNIKKETQKQKEETMITVKKFSATYCGSCRQLVPIFNELRQHFAGKAVHFSDIDVDENADSIDHTRHYNIKSVPTVVILKNGKEVGRFLGIRSLSEYISAIQNYI